MLGEVMKIFAYIYYFIWFICPFAFVFGLAHGIRELIQNNKEYNKGLTNYYYLERLSVYMHFGVLD